MSRKRRAVTDVVQPEADRENNAATQEVEENDDEKMPPTFMDTFYGLASTDPRDRTQAGKDMIHCCLVGPDANTKDAAYAFERLLKGLCSGRAAARQGFASALTSFLSVSLKLGSLQKIQEMDEESSNESLIGFVHRRLSAITDPSSDVGGRGRRKGSEERDFHFGRLFGILSVVRSGVLSPSQFVDVGDVKHVTGCFANDLVDLYHHKKWMREPASHAIITLLDFVYKEDNQEIANTVVLALVQKLFPDETAVEAFTAEQLAVAIKIQSNLDAGLSPLPAPLDHPVLSSQNIPALTDALCSTSIVSQPRTHIVWDMIWLYLSEATPSSSKGRRGRVQLRQLRENAPGSEESPVEVITALMRHVVVESLLGVGPAKTSGNSNATHERRSLALFLVRVLCGGESVSSNGQQFRLQTDAALVETVVLEPIVVRKLFLDIICAGGSNRTTHMLKPLSSSILDEIVSNDDKHDRLDWRLAVARAFLRCEPRFDSRTKTSSVAALVLMENNGVGNEGTSTKDMWSEYVNFLQHQILDGPKNDEADSSKRLYDQLGYIDLLFNATKFFLRTQSETTTEFAMKTVEQTLCFLACCAFYDVSAMSDAKKKRKGSQPTEMVSAATLIRGAFSKKESGTALFPYQLRVTMSARFYSLLADVAVFSPSRTETQSNTYNKAAQERRLLDLLRNMRRGRSDAQNLGAKLISEFQPEVDDDSSSVDPIDVDKIVAELQTEPADETGDKLKRLSTACGLLGSVLQLHLISCGSPDTVEDDIDLEDDEEAEAAQSEICEMISDLADAKQNLATKGEESSLLAIAEVCVGVLASAMGASQTRGGSRKLLKEVVRSVWAAALTLYADVSSQDETFIDPEVVHLLLSSIGSKSDSDDDDEEEEDDDDENDDDGSQMDTDEDGSNTGEGNEVSPSFAGAMAEDTPSERDSESEGAESIEEEDIAIDPAHLQTMLLDDDTDADENELAEQLEHHEGADAALAKLIKIKQQARKAGRLTRERIVLADQLRCAVLVEVLLSNHFGGLLRRSELYSMTLSLLRQREMLERALTKSTKEAKPPEGTSERRALLAKVTFLLRSKVFKLKHISKVGEEESNDVVEVAAEIAATARKAGSPEQLKCCGDALIMVCRQLENPEACSGVYSNAVLEWSTVRTTRFQASMFEDVIQQVPR